MLKQILKNVGVIVAGILVLSVTSFVSAWTAPTAVPPADNIAQPLNVSSTGQLKAGGLSLNTLAPGAANALLIPYGKIGFGDNTPDGSLKLDVEGPIGATTYCDQNGANCKTTSQMGGTTITGYCIQCCDARFGCGASACGTFGNWSGFTYFADDNNSSSYCRILIY